MISFGVEPVLVVHGWLFKDQKVVRVLLLVLLRAECSDALWGNLHTGLGLKIKRDNPDLKPVRSGPGTRPGCQVY
jgi:hypothetical protein